jgi:hypothetical protein
MTISQSKNNKLAKQAEDMVPVIANEIKLGECEIGYKAIREKHGVGTETAKKARELAGIKPRQMVGKPGPKPKSDLLMKDRELLRLSNGENLLTRAWL